MNQRRSSNNRNSNNNNRNRSGGGNRRRNGGGGGRPSHQRSGGGHHPHHRKLPQQDPEEQKFFASIAIDPAPRIQLEKGSNALTMRALDLICPIGRGQRGLIVAPPGSGKTTFLKDLCHAVTKSQPDIKLYCLLIDERPEEVTDFRRSVEADVRWSTTDQDYENHIETARNLMKDVYKQVNAGEHVMVMIDSLTRLGRVHNAEGRSSGRTLSGGMDSRAMQIPRRIFGSARNIENGGSLTILATILIDTGSRMDQYIFEEFKGTGNMEIVLSREIANQRVYPAVDINKSGTRREELLLDPTELEQAHQIRRALGTMNPIEAASGLVKQLQKYPTNKELLSVVAAQLKK